jgi:hypothetical protein
VVIHLEKQVGYDKIANKYRAKQIKVLLAMGQACRRNIV